MNELIRLKVNKGIRTVNARELHQFLEVKQQFRDWINRRISKYGFIENKDFFKAAQKRSALRIPLSKTGQTSIEYHLTLDMAKELSMVENNAKGKEARQYFISMEKAAKEFDEQLKLKMEQDKKAIAFKAMESIKILSGQLEYLERQIQSLKSKSEFFNRITNSTTAIDIGSVAKILNMGISRHQLFSILRKENILNARNQPNQEYIDRGYFRVIDQRYSKRDGSSCINTEIIVYKKGLDFIRKKILE